MSILLHPVGLALVGAVFVWAGIEHFLRFREVAASVAERGLPVPRLLLAVGSVLEIGAGTLLASGTAVPYAAAALAVFTVAATVTMLDFLAARGRRAKGHAQRFRDQYCRSGRADRHSDMNHQATPASRWA